MSSDVAASVGTGAGVARVMSCSKRLCVPAAKATVAALEFIAAAPSLPLDMPWSLQSRWTWSFPPA